MMIVTFRKALLSLLCGLVVCSAQASALKQTSSTPQSIDNESRIAAVVNEDSILNSELDARVRLVMLSSGLEDTAEVRAQIKDQILKIMIDELLQHQITKSFNIEPSKEEIENAFSNMEARNGMPKGGLDKFLADNHISRSVLINQIKAGLAWNQYIQERYRSHVQINQKDIKKVLDHLETDKAQPHVLLAEIVLTYDNASDQQKIKAEAHRLIEQLRKGTNFAVIAQQFSHSASASRGGDIGWMPLNQLEKPIREAITRMNEGDISDPIETKNGYHILLLRNKREAGSLGKKETVVTFHQAILALPKPLNDTTLENLFRKAAAISQNAKSPGMLEKLVKTFPSAQFKTMNRIPLTELNPQLRDLLVKLPLNKASQPLGSEGGVLIFLVSEKQEVSPEAPNEDEIFRNLLEQKLTLIAQRELRNLRRAAFINIRV